MEYVIKFASKAEELGYPAPYGDTWEEATKWDGYFFCLYRINDDDTIDFLQSDGGEPEDQTMGRDWSWIAEALNDAYKAGFLHGSVDEI